MSLKALLTGLLLTFSSLAPLYAQQSLVFTTINNTNIYRIISEEVLRLAYQELGININSLELPADQALRYANAGDADGELYRIAGLEQKYPNLVMVPVAINHLEGSVFTKKADFVVTGWESLRPYSIGIQKGIQFAEKGTEGMQRIIVSDPVQLFTMLQADELDIIVASHLNGLLLIKRLYGPEIRFLSPPVTTCSLYHYLHRKHEKLAKRLTSVLEGMARDGTIGKIRYRIVNQQFDLLHAIDNP